MLTRTSACTSANTLRQAANPPTKHETVPRKATQHATTAVLKAMSRESAHRRRNQSRVTNVVKRVTSPESARIRIQASALAVVAAGLVATVVVVVVAAAAVKSAISVVKLGISLGTVPKQVMEVTAVVVVAALEEVAATADAAVARPATLAAALATCLATALKDKSATTVSQQPVAFLQLTRSGGEVGHLSRDCTAEASGERVCYKCKQPGHVQAACPNA